MEESALSEYFNGKTVFITGATGFLAKVFIEKILRIQPNVNKMYLLIRGNNKRSVEQRLYEEIIDTELFNLLREIHGSDFNSTIMSTLVPVSGDVSCENLGIVNSELQEEMLQEIDIIVNSAATTKFDERYDLAFTINTLGARHVRDFATKCSKVDALVHISTAYVHGTKVGLISEKPFQMGETLDGSKLSYLDIDLEKKIIEEKLEELIQIDNKTMTEKEIMRAMSDLGIERAMLHGWPNTYVFTKAMGEMVLESFKEKARVIIIRPTIITSTYQEPFPGWVEGKLRTLDSIFAAYGLGKFKFFVGDPESILDMIPCDMVVNGILATLTSHPSHTQHNLSVYHIGSSRRNPLTFEEMKWLMYDYLSKKPLPNNQGKVVNVGPPKTLSTMASFHKHMAIRYVPLLQILKLLNVVSFNFFKSTYVDANRRLNHALRLADIYKPYLFFRGIFDDTNTEDLRMAIRRSNMDVDMLKFDPTSIKWGAYFLDIHFPGVAKYALK